MTKISRILLLILVLLTTWAYTIDIECLWASANDTFCAGETKGETICLCNTPSIPHQNSIKIKDHSPYLASFLMVSGLLPESNEKAYKKPSIPYFKIDFNHKTPPRAPPIA